MKKRIFALLLCALMLVCTMAAAELNRVADNAGLLSAAQVSALSTRCRTLSEQYSLDIIIATTDDSRDMELEQYAATLVDYNDFRTDNIILVIAMDQRKYTCVTTGKGIDAFSDQELESIYDAMESDMRTGNYDSACDTFLSRCSTILKAYANGTGAYSYGIVHAERSFAERLKTGALFALIPAVGIGWLIAAAQKSKMKTARRRDSAENYMTGMNLTRERDIYLYTTTVRHRIAQNPPAGGRPGGGGPHGGGGTHHTFTGSSGARHGGGGGRGF